MYRPSKNMIAIVFVLALSVGITFLLLVVSKPEPCLGEIAFVSDRSGKNEVYLMNAGCSEEAQAIKSTCNTDAGEPIWSLDGKKVVYPCIEQGIMAPVSGIHMFDPETNRDTVIIDCHERACAANGDISELQWTHNGACLAWSTHNHTSLFTVELGWSEDGKQPDPICGGWGGSAKSPYTNESCSPNGKYCLYAHSRNGEYETYFISTSGIPNSVAMDVFHGDLPARFSAPGISAFVIVNDLFLRGDWSPNSDYVALTLFDDELGSTSSLYLVDPRHPEMVHVASGLDGGGGRLSCSPDSRWVAFSAGSDIYVVEVQTGKVRRVTTDPAIDSSPMWRPLHDSD